jgi:hypothetical protein
MELHNPARPIRTRRQESRPEMQCIGLLAKSGTWYEADTSRIEQFQAVELVGLVSCFLSGFNGFFGKRDGGEKVHGALHIISDCEGYVEGGKGDLQRVIGTLRPPSP